MDKNFTLEAVGDRQRGVARPRVMALLLEQRGWMGHKVGVA